MKHWMRDYLLAMTAYVVAMLALAACAFAADVYRVRVPGVTEWITVEVERVDEPAPEPEPIPEPEPEPKPQPDTGDHAHYAARIASPHLHASASLRTQAGIEALSNNGKGGPNSEVTYDPVADAAKVIVEPGDSDIDGRNHLCLWFPPVLPSEGATEVSVQWEARWDSSYLDCAKAGLTGHKHVWLMRNTKPQLSAGRRIEVKADYQGIEEGSICLPTLRLYGIGWVDLAAVGEQPGGVAEQFYIQPGQWTRFTVSLTCAETGEQRVRIWMADQSRDPVLTCDVPLFDVDPPSAGLDQWRLVMDSSQERASDRPLTMHVRNVLVFKNATVPLGGRPKGE